MDYSSLVNKKIALFGPEELLSKVINKVKEDKVIFVKDKKKFYGAVSKKATLLLGTDMAKLKLKNLAKPVPEITKKTGYLDLVKFFVEANTEKLPYFEGQELVGSISRNAVLEQIISKNLTATVEETMSKNLVFVNYNDNLAQVLALFREHGFTKLIVLTNGELAGVITITNIFNYLAKGDRVNLDNLRNTKVKDVMKEDIISIGPKKPIQEAIKKFINGKTSSIVVHENKETLGILTKTDILEKYLAAEKKQSFVVQISSKLEKLPTEVIEKKVEQLKRFFREEEEIHIFVHLSFGREKYKGAPLVHCRMRLLSPRNCENISVEAWGVDQAVELAIQKLKRRIIKDRETFY
jgi:predicted transcriptional regulator/ribosome-associated translation inhibitor RaiA